MIETKQQYEQIRDLKYPAPRVATIHIGKLTEVIEALREVARAADKLVHHTKGYEEADAAETALAFKVEALAYWLIEGDNQ